MDRVGVFFKIWQLEAAEGGEESLRPPPGESGVNFGLCSCIVLGGVAWFPVAPFLVGQVGGGEPRRHRVVWSFCAEPSV